MEVVRLHNKDINRILWDEVIDSSESEMPYYYSWYLDTVCPEWEAIISKDYSSLFPLPVKKKLGVKYLFQPPFFQRTTLLGKDNPDFINSIQEFLNEFEFGDFNVGNASFTSKVELNNYVINLNISHDKLKENFSQGCKRNTNKSIGVGNEIKQYQSTSELNGLLDTFNKTKAKKLEISFVDEMKVLKQLVIEAEKRNMLNLALVKSQEGHTIGGIVLVNSKKRTTLIFSAANEEARKSGAMHHLVSETILSMDNQPRIFDFEGSMDPGIAQFYRGFGGDVEKYYHFSANSGISKILSVFKSN